MNGTDGAGRDSGNGGGRLSRMAGREGVHGAAERLLGERVRERNRLWRIPTFWVIVLIAFIALLLMLLTSCGRVTVPQGDPGTPQVPSASADPARQRPPADGGADSSPASSGDNAASPSGDIDASGAFPAVTGDAGSDHTSGGSGQAEDQWPVPKGSVTEDGVRYGYADAAGKFVIAPEFVRAHPFTALGVALVEDGADNRAVIDRRGEFVIPWRQAGIQVPDNGPILLSPVQEGTGRSGTEALALGLALSNDVQPAIERQYVDAFAVNAHPGKLLHVLVNLIRNGCEAMADVPEAQRCLTVTLRREADMGVFLVRDNGFGLTGTQLRSLFLYGETTKPEGHGIGLHTSANDITAMGGEITAQSEGLNLGATFIVRLPLANQRTNG